MSRSPASVLVDSSGNLVGVVLDGAVYRLQAETTITDGADVLDVLSESVPVSGLNGVLCLGKTQEDLSTFILTQPDGAQIVVSKPPSPPPGTTPYQASVDEAELRVGAGGDVSSPHTTLGPIVANGEALTLQSIELGTEGDSSENGSVVEIYWREGAPATDHIVGRYYAAGETVQVIFPDTTQARDGTVFLGDGSTTRLVALRKRLSASALEIDFIVRGYTS